MKNYYKIGEISKLYGIGPDSLRYYEKLGILHPKREANGYRLYDLKDMYKLNVIGDLRLLDFSMAQIREYLENQSIENTLSLLLQEQELLKQKIKELQTKESVINKRIAALNAAGQIRPGAISIKHLAGRPCVQLTQHITKDEEMDFVIKRLHKKYEKIVPELVSQTVGACFSMEDWKRGVSNVYESVFFILEEDSLDYDFLLPAGDYLSCYYRGGYQQNGRRIQELLDYACSHGLSISGDPFELYEIDNRYTGREEEFLTEIQVPIIQSQKTQEPERKMPL